MFTGRIPPSRFLAALGMLLAFGFNAMAARPTPVSEVKTLHEFAAISGTGFLTFEPYFPIEPGIGGVITITGTGGLTILPPPIYSYASGTVDLVAAERSGTTSGVVRLTTRGMQPGSYTVSAVTESSSDTLVLGSLTVTSGSIPVFVSGSGPVPVDYYPAPWLSTGSARFGGTAHPFPAGLSPFDIATVSISDSDNNVIGAATLTPVPRGYLTALSPVQPGPLAGTATGYAVVHADSSPLLLLDPTPTLTAATTFSKDAETSTDQGAGSTLSLGSGGTLSLGNSGTVTLNGNGGYTGVTTVGSGTITLPPPTTSGSLTLVGSTPTPISIAGPVGIFNIGSGTTYGSLSSSGGTFLLNSGTIITGLPIQSGGPHIVIDPYPPASPAGRLAIHAAGLPPHTAVTYALDGADIGTAMTDASGKLNVFTRQGGYGKIPSSIDLFSVNTLTVHDSGGNLYLSAGF